MESIYPKHRAYACSLAAFCGMMQMLALLQREACAWKADCNSAVSQPEAGTHTLAACSTCLLG
eukprot:scaffold109039_cov22-Tisochrysis_lutea.AAC.1